MAWSDPGDFTGGQVLTAAQMDSVREAMFLGQATFTNEAARDAAIPATGIALQEGMRAYLTAATVPAATGGTTYIPTGITTVYNGSAWVCITPVGAFTSNIGTRNGAFSPTLAGSPGTNPSVTITTGTTALVSISALLRPSALQTIEMDVAVSGATTIAAGTVTAQGTYVQTGVDAGLDKATQAVFIVSGLNAGSNTFTLNYASNNTASYSMRRIIVQGIA